MHARPDRHLPRPDLDHPLLGRLVYDAEFQWYAGLVTVGDQPIEVQVPIDRAACDPLSAEPAALLHAARVVERLDQLAPQARACAARELLPTYNDQWRAPDADPLDAAALAERLQLLSLLVSRDGTAEFFHDDGGLFDDACVLVRMEPDEQFTDAQLVREEDE